MAAENERQLLHALHRYGWLTARQLGQLIWPTASRGQLMAQRTVGRLLKRGLVAPRSLPHGARAYVLSPRGAAVLREMGVYGVRAKGGADLPLGPSAVYHRAISNAFLIDRTLAFSARSRAEAGTAGICTEHEIQRHRAPRPARYPDGHVFVPDAMWHQDARYVWVEVENSAKSPARLYDLVQYADRVLSSEEDPPRYDALISPDQNAVVGHIHGFLMLCPNAGAFRACVRALQRYGRERFCDAARARVAVALVEMSPALVWGGVKGEWSIDELAAAGYLG